MNNFMKFIQDRTRWLTKRSRFFSGNTTPKIVSVIFALVMWLYVMGEVNPESIEEWKNVNVQILNVDELRQAGLVIIGQTDFTVNVKVKGKRNDLYKISPKDMVVRADLRGFRKGVNSVPLEYSAPSDISIVDISPREIKVTLDEIVKRQKPVAVQTVGEAAQGYEPATAVVSPSEVIVEGPETLVNAVAMVVVEVNLNNRLNDISDKLPLKAVNREGKEVIGVEVKTKLVEVAMPIYKVKEVPILVDLQGRPQQGYKITKVETSPGFVLIKGPANVVDKISEITTKSVKVDNLRETTSQDMVLILPEGVEAPYMEKTPSVIVTVEKIMSKEFNFSRNEIAVENLDNKYRIELGRSPDTIRVELEAVESVLKDLKREDIQLYLNVTGLEEGRYSAGLLYSMPIIPEKIVITPNKLDFEIRIDRESQPASGGDSGNTTN